MQTTQVESRVNLGGTGLTSVRLLNWHKISAEAPDPLKGSGVKDAGRECKGPAKVVGASGTKDDTPPNFVEKWSLNTQEPTVGAAGFTGVKEALVLPFVGSLLVFSFSKPSVSSTESNVVATFEVNCRRKLKNEMKFESQGTWT